MLRLFRLDDGRATGLQLAIAVTIAGDAPYVLRRHPEIIYPHLGFLQNHRWTENDYRTVDPDTFVIGGVNEMVANPRFWNDYRATGVEILPGKWFNFFLRRDAPIRGVS